MIRFLRYEALAQSGLFLSQLNQNTEAEMDNISLKFSKPYFGGIESVLFRPPPLVLLAFVAGNTTCKNNNGKYFGLYAA